MPPRGREYRFVATPGGQNPTTREFQRTVRSHAASVSRSDNTTRRRARIRERNQGEGVIVFDINSTDTADESDPQLSSATAHADELTILPRRRQPPFEYQQFDANTPWAPYQLRPDSLSGNSFSPLMHLATYHRPYLPGIFNHYIYNLTIPIPELDGNSAEPLFRAAWLPIVFHDPVVFQVVVLFAATHYATFADPSQFTHLHLELLSLKQSALLALIERVQNEQTIPSTSTNRGLDTRDTLVAAAAKMASYEAIFGTAEAFHLHMSTVVRLLRQRGGLNTLGMDGFLSKLLSFIDTNSAFLLGTNLYLVEFGLPVGMPHHQPFGRVDGDTQQPYRPIRNTNVVNLERFVGFMNISNENTEASHRS